MRRNRITTLASVLVIPLVLALALPAMASEQSGKIAGTVFDPDGVPLAGVTVTITAKEMMGKRQSQTAEDGSFLFFGLPPGKYTILIEQPGFLPLKHEHVPVRNRDPGPVAGAAHRRRDGGGHGPATGG